MLKAVSVERLEALRVRLVQLTGVMVVVVVTVRADWKKPEAQVAPVSLFLNYPCKQPQHSALA